MKDFAKDFPSLDANNHRLTSPITSDYNCIAWAAEEDDRWWWPGPVSVSYWPQGIARVPTCDAFVDAFKTIGYDVCVTPELEEGFAKVALYVDANNNPTHMARQLADGTWTSKLGQAYDINHHTLEAISGPTYGAPSVFLRKRV